MPMGDMKTAKKFRSRLLIISGLTVLALCFSWSKVSSQSKKSLEKQRNELNEKIELTKKLIRESEKNQKTTSAQVQMLNEQLHYREQLLANINSDIETLDSEIGVKSQDVEELKSQLELMKDEYAKMVTNAYIHRSAHDKLMFLFSAENFNQAYKRFKYTQRYAEIRKEQVHDIMGTREEIESNITALQSDKIAKEQLANNKEKEKQEIEQNKNDQKKKLAELKTEEETLRSQQKKQKADRDKLTAKIQQIIAEEIKKEQEKALAEQKAKAAKANASGTTVKTDNATKTSSKAIELAPETKLANADFESNKGSLPWPVSAGVVTSAFGKHPHASLENVVVNNNGVDFHTENGTSALAVFNGTVTSVFSIPGAGQNIIVTHGSYKTVYSGLSNVSVKVGDKVTTKQKLGTVMNDGDESTLHFEVWKVGSESGSAQNPEAWIKKK